MNPFHNENGTPELSWPYFAMIALALVMLLIAGAAYVDTFVP